MRWILVLGALLASGAARAGLPDFAPSGAGVDFAAARAVAQRPPAGEPFAVLPGASGAPLQSIPLAPILDAVRATKASFRAGGVVVHVFGGKSQNKKNWFVGFQPEGGEAIFFKGWKMLRWMIKHGSARFEIGGRRFTAYIDGKATDKLNSRLVVAEENGAQSSWSMAELSDDAFEKGYPVSIAGQEYRLMYTRDFNEDASGDFGAYTGDRSLTLMTRAGGKLIGYHWFEREIPADRILVSTPKIAGIDDYRAGSFSVGLRLNRGALEIYSPAPAVASN
jgi:hypothetical protein